MADPLSIAAGVAGLVSFAIQVTQGFHDYYSAYRRQNDEVAHLCSNIDSLSTALLALSEALESRQTDQELIKSIETAVQGSRDIIEELEEELSKIKPPETQTFKGRFKAASYRLRYPFLESTLQKLREQIKEFLGNISIALDVLNAKDVQRISEGIDEVKIAVDQVRALHASQANRNWLHPPDPSSNHHDNCLKRHEGTGLWFTKSVQFENWLNGKFWLWLCGFAGCGKSVLCSTAIKETFSYKALNPKKIGVGYFYFSFTDNSKQDIMAMLRSIVLQIASQTSNGENELDKVRGAQSSSDPSLQTLLKLFKSLLADFDAVYLLIDALDEVSEYHDREHVLSTLEELYKWNESKLHLLVTSRDHLDIHEVMTSISQTVLLENEGVDDDIARYIRGHLSTNRRLQKWREKQKYRDLIEEALTQGANGMFRWVECQFEALAKTPASQSMLARALQSLPRSLDQTYQRMLLAINGAFWEEAKRILMLICFAQRPLFDEEISEFLTIKSVAGKPPQFDPGCRLDSVDAIMDICPGFLHVSEDFLNGMPAKKIQIAHFSVQEYLVSERIHQAPGVEFFHLDPETCHEEITQACLTYWLSGVSTQTEPEKDRNDNSDWKFQQEYPLYLYVCSNWNKHYRACKKVSDHTNQLGFELLVNNYKKIEVWLRVRGKRFSMHTYTLVDRPTRISALHLAALLGLHSLANHILEQAKLSEHPVPALLNGKEFKALSLDKTGDGLPGSNQSFQLKDGASNHTPETLEPYEDFFNAMHSATIEGYTELVELLLDHGMGIDAMGSAVHWLPYHAPAAGPYVYPPLVLAFLQQNVPLSKYLISRGADIDLAALHFKVDPRGDVLMERHENPIKISFFREVGVDLAGSCSSLGRTIIFDAISRQDPDEVRNCLHQGVKIVQSDSDIQPCLFCHTCHNVFGRGRSLHPSSEEMLGLIVAQLDDVLVGSVGCENCLISAARVGRADSVHSLKPHLCSKFGSVKYLHWCTLAATQACNKGRPYVLKTLVDEGASVQSIVHQLLWCSRRNEIGSILGIEDCFKVLLEYVDNLTEHQSFVLLAASGDVGGVKQVLQRAQSLPTDLAIAWAARFGHVDTVRGLFYHCGSYPSWAVGDAIQTQSVDVLAFFLNVGVDWLQDDGTALGYLVREGPAFMAETLLETGADPNKCVGSMPRFSTIDPLPEEVDLQELSSYGSTLRLPGHYRSVLAPISIVRTVEMAKLLLEYGASVTRPGTLELCQSYAQDFGPIVKLYIEHGADVNQLFISNHSVLTEVAYFCGPEDLKCLCEAGATINPAPKESAAHYNNPLVAAVASGKCSNVELLLDQGALIYDSTLRRATNNQEMLRILHKHLSTHGLSIEAMRFDEEDDPHTLPEK